MVLMEEVLVQSKREGFQPWQVRHNGNSIDMNSRFLTATEHKKGTRNIFEKSRKTRTRARLAEMWKAYTAQMVASVERAASHLEDAFLGTRHGAAHSALPVQSGMMLTVCQTACKLAVALVPLSEATQRSKNSTPPAAR